MNDRPSRLKSEEIINRYELAVYGDKAKKRNKKSMRKLRRTIEKRMTRTEADE